MYYNLNQDKLFTHFFITVARRFAQLLRRQTSLNHLCQAARSVVHNPDVSAQMLEDWISVDLNSIIKQTMYTMEGYNERVTDIIVSRKNAVLKILSKEVPNVVGFLVHLHSICYSLYYLHLISL